MNRHWEFVVNVIVVAVIAFLFFSPEKAASNSHIDSFAGPVANDERSSPMFVAGIVSQNNLPSHYDLRDHHLITPVKNQNGMRADGISDLGTSVGLCWAFASLNSFESSMLKQGLATSPMVAGANLSPWHLGNYINYNMPVYDIDKTLMPGVLPATTMGYVKPEGGWGGGGAFWTCDYIIRGDGPLLWQDEPMPNVQMSNHETLRKPGRGLPANYLVKEMLLFDPEDFTDEKGDVDEVKFRDKIKRALLKYGAVQSFIHLEAIDCPGVEKQTCNGRIYDNHRFMDKVNNNLYTYETEDLCTDLFTHAVSIAGWDDDRIIQVDGHVSRGAWLIKDSIGESSHEKGYFWVAYDDKVHLQFIASAFVALSGEGYKKPSSYQTHPGGMSRIFPGEDTAMNEENIISMGAYGYLLDGYNHKNQDSWGIARFQLNGNEVLRGVGIFTSNQREIVTVRIYKSWRNFTVHRDNPLYTETFSVGEKGYHLLNLEKEIPLLAGEELVVGVGFRFVPGQAKQPLVYVRDNNHAGSTTYRTSYTPESGWSGLSSYENACPGFWAGFFLQAVMASGK